VPKKSSPPRVTSFCGLPVWSASVSEPQNGVKPLIGHLEDSAGVGRLIAIEKQVRFRRVGVLLARPLQHAEGDEGVEKILGAAVVKIELLFQRRQIFRTRWRGA